MPDDGARVSVESQPLSALPFEADPIMEARHC